MSRFEPYFDLKIGHFTIPPLSLQIPVVFEIPKQNARRDDVTMILKDFILKYHSFKDEFCKGRTDSMVLAIRMRQSVDDD